MVGAVGVALGIEYDRSGIFTFLVPGVIGIFILFAAWVRKNSFSIHKDLC
jgi:lipoprotein signal peptidase